MPKYDIQREDPARYAIVKEQQEKLKKEFDGKISVVIECPYCHHKGGRLFQGTHGAVEAKCEKCGETFIFPPVVFSRAKPARPDCR